MTIVNCFRCNKPIGDNLRRLQRCPHWGCRRLDNDEVEEIEQQNKKFIFGPIRRYCFSNDKEKLYFVTLSYKRDNFYSYDLKTKKITWKICLFRNDPKTIGNIHEIFVVQERPILFISASSAERGESRLIAFNKETGNQEAEFRVIGQWTNLIKCKDNIIIGCRNGYIYLINKDLQKENEFCIKDKNVDYRSAWAVPSPFNITTNETEDFISFSSESTLYLLDDRLNYVWDKEVISEMQFGGAQNVNIQSVKLKDEKYKQAYEALKIEPTFDQQLIKKAFRRMALKWHPDRHEIMDKAFAEEKFKEIVNAYELLMARGGASIEEELNNLGLRNNLGIFFFCRITQVRFIKSSIIKEELIEVVLGNNGVKQFNFLGKNLKLKEELKIIKAM